MGDPMSDYVYDPTRRFRKIYDYTLGLILMIIGSVATVVMTLVTLGITLGDHNYSGGLITGAIVLFAIFLASPMLNCNGNNVRIKRKVYSQYLNMNRADRKKYADLIREIHKDKYNQESISYDDLAKLFKNKSYSNVRSIESKRAMVKQELKDIKAMEKLNAGSMAEVDGINKAFDL